MAYFEKHKVVQQRMWKLFTKLFPFMLSITLLKLLIWFFEAKTNMIHPELSDILTMLGIIMGIILALAVSFAVSKYKEANDNLDNTRAILWAIGDFMLRKKISKKDRETFIEKTRQWLESYRGYLKNRNSKKEMIRKFREFSLGFDVFDRYKISDMHKATLENWRCQLSRFMSGEDSLKSIRTPLAYWDFLRISVMVYIIGICFAYPSFVGLIIANFAAFFFGGIYILAVDFDNPFGHEEGEIVDVDIDTPISDAQYYLADDY